MNPMEEVAEEMGKGKFLIELGID